MVNSRLVDFFYNRKTGWLDGTAVFIAIIKKHCRADFVVLDLGAGSGQGREKSYSLKGLVKLTVGVDISKKLYKNENIDKKVFGNAYNLPFKTEAFDLIYADYVLEHITQAQDFVKELSRVLKKGGRFIFRTPNLYHYVTLIARITPQSLKLFLNNYIKKDSGITESFSAFYKMNTVARLKKIFLSNGFFAEALQLLEKEPSYLMFNALPFLVGVCYERIVNSMALFAPLRSNIIGVFKK